MLRLPPGKPSSALHTLRALSVRWDTQITEQCDLGCRREESTEWGGVWPGGGPKVGWPGCLESLCWDTDTAWVRAHGEVHDPSNRAGLGQTPTLCLAEPWKLELGEWLGPRRHRGKGKADWHPRSRMMPHCGFTAAGTLLGLCRLPPTGVR